MTLQPFFTSTAQKATARTPAKRNMGAGGCDACGLYKTCKSPKMPATGNGKKGILVLAEAPGKNEDERGIQLIGKSGERLRRELERVGIDLDEDCRKLNAVNCRPPANKTPSDVQVAYCRHRVMAEINEFKPTSILALGGPAMKSLAQHRALWDKGFPGIMNWQGEVIPDRDLGAYIIPTWHPAYILRLDGHPVFERKWRQDLKNLATHSEIGAPPEFDCQSGIEVIINPDVAAKKLEDLYRYLLTLDDPIVCLDYEATGKKPYVDGHKLFSCSLCWKEGTAISFLLNDATWVWVERILRNPTIKKTAHNMKFEHIWTRVRGNPVKGGFEIKGWFWDSMQGAFILDNRVGKAGLKLQGYIKYGVLGYDTSTAHFLKSDGKDSNTLNRIEEAPVRDLLLYGGIDTVLARKLALDQKRKIDADEGLKEAYELWHNGALALADAEFNGIVTDRKYCEKAHAHLDRRINHLKKKILDYPEVQLWQKLQGNKFNINSRPQLAHLLFSKEGLGLESKKETESGNASVDREVLDDLDLAFAKDMVKISKLQKLQGTYLKGFLTEAPDGIMHPFYNLTTVVSFRGSCLAKDSLVMVNRGYEESSTGIPIQDVLPGDLVFCFDGDRKPTLKKVLWAGKTGKKKVVRLHWRGHGGKKGFLDLTPEHKIRMADGVYVAAKNVMNYLCRIGATEKNPGGLLLRSALSMTRTGERDKDRNHIITAVEELENLVDVYDLTVEGSHNFIANEICVHNCDSPSFQNIPKRDTESQQIVREALHARPGMLWLEIDYSSIEVRIAATYHKDPNMLKYLHDPNSDMHRDMAMQIFILPADLVSKYLRNAAKNGFVFAQFYGDWFQACAINIWTKWLNSPDALLTNGVHAYEHLRKKGIKDLESFIRHMKKVEDHFWNKRFPVYGQWREDNWELYRKKGWMRSNTGFIYNAIMDRKQTSNYGTQGAGFHCLLRSMIEANNVLKKEKWLSFINGQIHDALELNAHPSEINRLLPLMRKIMVEDLVARYDWINVPMDIEYELAPLGKSWANLKQVFERPNTCECGLDWGYKKKDEAFTKWTCPVCDHVEYEI